MMATILWDPELGKIDTEKKDDPEAEKLRLEKIKTQVANAEKIKKGRLDIEPLPKS